MTDGILTQIVDSPIAWNRDSLSESDGLVTLSDGCLAELDAVAALLAENPIPALALRPEDFDLAQCRARMAAVRRELDEGVGFALIDRLPVERYGRAGATAIYWLLASMVSRPVAQNWQGRMIYDVLDTGNKPGNGVRPDITNVEQNFHTDNSYNLCPPDYVALLCLQNAAEGGVSRIVSFASVHNEMLHRHASLLPRLYRPYCFDRQREHAPDDSLVVRHPLFAFADGRLTARLSRFQVVNGHRLAEEALDAEGETALECLESIMNEPRFWKEFVFRPGQIQIIDNRRCGHKRTAFRDPADPDRKRHLVRLWLRESGRRFYNG